MDRDADRPRRRPRPRPDDDEEEDGSRRITYSTRESEEFKPVEMEEPPITIMGLDLGMVFLLLFLVLISLFAFKNSCGVVLYYYTYAKPALVDVHNSDIDRNTDLLDAKQMIQTFDKTPGWFWAISSVCLVMLVGMVFVIYLLLSGNFTVAGTSLVLFLASLTLAGLMYVDRSDVWTWIMSGTSLLLAGLLFSNNFQRLLGLEVIEHRRERKIETMEDRIKARQAVLEEEDDPYAPSTPAPASASASRRTASTGKPKRPKASPSATVERSEDSPKRPAPPGKMKRPQPRPKPKSRPETD